MQAQAQINSLTQKDIISNEDLSKIEVYILKIIEQIKEGVISMDDFLSSTPIFDQSFIDNTIQGHALKKPFGYAGDFLIIDKIYTYHKSEDAHYRVWDEYFHLHSAPIAVRNRKEYFKNLIRSKFAAAQTINLLNVASGPVRDLLEMYSDMPAGKILNSTCVEMDINAIEYAKNLNKKYLNLIKFEHANIFKYRDTKKYNLIWSAGLFDYFDDRTFIFVLKRFKEWISDCGEIVIGNFNEDNNPSRDYMEIFGEWYLNHRTEAQLISLAREAGFQKEQISIGKEPENVNLFLHIKSK